MQFCYFANFIRPFSHPAILLYLRHCLSAYMSNSSSKHPLLKTNALISSDLPFNLDFKNANVANANIK